jgi:dihydroflavonol-4-reductase
MAAEGSGRVLVTGGAGFIGSHVVELLLAQGRPVRVLEKPGVSTAHLPAGDVEILFADLRDAGAIAGSADGCDVVLHLAANPNLWARDAREFEEVNHQGTRRVLDAARRAGASRVVHVSTESILAPPGHSGLITEATETTLDDMIGPYCRSKWLADEAARQAAAAGDPVVVVRPTIPVGAGDRLMGPPSRMIRDFCNGRLKACLDGDLNLIDVRDIAAGIWAAARRGEPGRSYLLANENWTIPELFGYLAELTGQPAQRTCVPYPLALAFAHLEEWLCRHVLTGRSPMATVTGVRLTQRPLRFDGSQSAKELGLLPMRDCRAAIRAAVEWFRAAAVIA